MAKKGNKIEVSSKISTIHRNPANMATLGIGQKMKDDDFVNYRAFHIGKYDATSPKPSVPHRLRKPHIPFQGFGKQDSYNYGNNSDTRDTNTGFKHSGIGGGAGKGAGLSSSGGGLNKSGGALKEFFSPRKDKFVSGLASDCLI